PIRLAREEAVRNLHEHAGPVPRARITPDGAAVHEVLQYRDAVPHDLVRAPAVDVHHEPYPATGVLEEGIVQPFALHPDAWIYGMTGRCHVRTLSGAAVIS